MTRRIMPWSGHCELCDDPIQPGSEVYADDDTAAVHAECLDRETEDNEDDPPTGGGEEFHPREQLPAANAREIDSPPPHNENRTAA